MLNKFFVTLLVAMISASIVAETFRGTLIEFSRQRSFITLKVEGHAITFHTSPATKYLDADGKDQQILRDPEFSMRFKGSEINVVANPDDVAASIQFPVQFAAPTAVSSISMSDTARRFEGKPVPAFNMKSLHGKSISAAGLRGKIVVLDFWATWCGPCTLLSPFMQSLQEKFGSKGVVVIGADVMEHGDAKSMVAHYASSHGYSFRFTYDNQSYVEKLGIKTIPCILIIDKLGVVTRAFVGYQPQMKLQIEAILKQLLAKKT